MSRKTHKNSNCTLTQKDSNKLIRMKAQLSILNDQHQPLILISSRHSIRKLLMVAVPLLLIYLAEIAVCFWMGRVWRLPKIGTRLLKIRGLAARTIQIQIETWWVSLTLGLVSPFMESLQLLISHLYQGLLMIWRGVAWMWLSRRRMSGDCVWLMLRCSRHLTKWTVLKLMVEITTPRSVIRRPWKF
jgi:hypothetical protein